MLRNYLIITNNIFKTFLLSVLKRGANYTNLILLLQRSHYLHNTHGTLKIEVRTTVSIIIPTIILVITITASTIGLIIIIIIIITTRACNVPSSSLTSYWTQTIAVALQKRISKAQIICANRVYAVRHLEKTEDMNSYHMENHLNWENQESKT